MSLIHFQEILPPKEDYLKDYLYTQLKNQCSWRDNRSDAVQDQLKFFDTYFSSKKPNSSNFKNSHISKDIIEDNLKESEKVHHSQMNLHISNKSKFIELSQSNTNEDNFNLFFFDNTNRFLNAVNFTANFQGGEDKDEDNIKIKLEDISDFPLDYDTSLRGMAVPQSSYFKQGKENTSNYLSMDMYSIYNTSLEFDIDKGIQLYSFDKVFTLDEIPNCFMSGTLVDRFFVISNSLEQLDNKNRITLFDNEFKKVNSKILNALDKPFHKGDFFNHPSVIILFNESGEMILSDFRSREPFEKKINNRITSRISHIKYHDQFKFIVFSPKTISLFDMRFPSLPVSESPLNINYKDMEVKPTFNSDVTSTNFIGVDSSRSDYSLLLFNILQDDLDTEFFSEFVDTKLIKTSREVSDSAGILIEDQYFINFIVDEFAGLYSATYSIINSNNYTKAGVTKIDPNLYFLKDDKDLLEKDLTSNKDVKIVQLFEKVYLDSIYQKEKVKINRIKYTKNMTTTAFTNEEEELSDESITNELDDVHIEDKSDSGESDAVDFGTVEVNGKQQKMYKLENKRKLLEELLFSKEEEDLKNKVKVEEDVEMNNEDEEDDEDRRIYNNLTNNNKEFEWLFDVFDKK